MSKKQSIMVYEDTKTKTTRYEVNGVDITSSIEVLKEQFLNQWNNEHKLTTELSFYERNKYAKQISDLEAKLAESKKENMELASKVDLLESEKENLFRTLEEANEEVGQDIIEFAITELEKVKEYLLKYYDNNIYQFSMENGNGKLTFNKEYLEMFINRVFDNEKTRLTHQHEDKGE